LRWCSGPMGRRNLHHARIQVERTRQQRNRTGREPQDAPFCGHFRQIVRSGRGIMLVSLRTVPLLFGVTLGLGCSTNDAEKAAQPQTTGPTEVGSASPDAAAPPPPKARPSSELPTPVSLSGEHRPGTLALVAPG